jgi:hypothetical protein
MLLQQYSTVFRLVFPVLLPQPDVPKLDGQPVKSARKLIFTALMFSPVNWIQASVIVIYLLY